MTGRSPLSTPPGSLFYAVWDGVTANLLGEFDTQAEAEAFIDRIKPYGRFGPDGHDLIVIPTDSQGMPVDA